MGKKYTKAQTKKYLKKKAKAKKILAYYKNSNGKQIETKIERKIREFLQAECIPFTQEYGVCHTLRGQKRELYRKFDFLVCNGEGGGSFKFYIECDGDYFHAKDYVEGITPKSKLTWIQRKNLRNDSKKTRIAKEQGIPLLRFWERTINKDFENIKLEILAEINRQLNTK